MNDTNGEFAQLRFNSNHVSLSSNIERCLKPLLQSEFDFDKAITRVDSIIVVRTEIFARERQRITDFSRKLGIKPGKAIAHCLHRSDVECRERRTAAD